MGGHGDMDNNVQLKRLIEERKTPPTPIIPPILLVYCVQCSTAKILFNQIKKTKKQQRDGKF